jgi:hypothetical protein
MVNDLHLPLKDGPHVFLLHGILQDVFGRHHVVTPEELRDICRFMEEAFHHIEEFTLRRRRRYVGSVCRRLQSIRQVILVEKYPVSGVKLSRKQGVCHDLLEETNRPQAEIQLETTVVLGDIRRSLVAAIEDKRVAIQDEHPAKGFEPVSMGEEGLDVAQRQDDVVVR